MCAATHSPTTARCCGRATRLSPPLGTATPEIDGGSWTCWRPWCATSPTWAATRHSPWAISRHCWLACATRGLASAWRRWTIPPSRDAHLRHLGIAGRLDFVVGADAGHGEKPAPGMVHRLLRRASGCEPEEVIVVGDTPADLLMARNAGCALAVARAHRRDARQRAGPPGRPGAAEHPGAGAAALAAASMLCAIAAPGSRFTRRDLKARRIVAAILTNSNLT